MSVHFEVESDDYELKANSKVTANATIGNAQGGGWRMTLDDVEIGKGFDPEDIDVPNAAAGQTLEVQVTCVDINEATNKTVATLVLKGGKKPAKFVQKYDDGDEGDTTVFTFVVSFV